MQEAPKPLWFGASRMFINIYGKRLALWGGFLIFAERKKKNARLHR
jgi:hypothetical protein